MSVAAGPGPARQAMMVEGILERITYVNDETGYTIARLTVDGAGTDLVTVVGPLLGAQVGESLRLTGR